MTDGPGFVASRPLPPVPRVPALAVSILRIAVPELSQDLSLLALRRFSGTDRLREPLPLVVEVLRSSGRLMAALVFMLMRTGGQRTARPRVDLLMYCGAQTYYDVRLRAVHQALADWRIVRAGIDVSSIEMAFSRSSAMRIFIVSPLVLLPLMFESLRAGSNLVQGYLRSVVVFAQWRRFFSENPARAFLTYEENNCTAPAYAAFRASGGEVFAAFQNGIWFEDEGFDHLRFDLLFPIGQAWLDRHARLGSVIGEAIPIGSLAIGTNDALRDPAALDTDVLFLDQGDPDAGGQHWGAAGAAGVPRFLDYIRRFSIDRPSLRIGYQCRYRGDGAQQVSQAIQQALAGASIDLRAGDGKLAGYHAVRRARVVVTMNSTLGLEAVALGRPTLFCNVTGSAAYDVVPGASQLSSPGYDEFAQRLDAMLGGDAALPAAEAAYFISAETAQAPRIVAAALRRALEGATAHA